MLRENLSLKVASLALAILVWFYVRGEDEPVQILTVPLELEGLASDLALSGEVADTVSVRVRAPELVLRAISPDKFLARVDLSNLGAGEQMIRVRADSIGVPAGVEVLRVTPEYIPLKVEKKVERKLPVRPRIAGNPAGGHVLGDVTVSPPQVTVAGPESAVRRARQVETDVVRIDGRSSPFEVVVDLFPDAAGLEIADSGTAQIQVDIHERYVTRVLAAVKVVAEGASFQVRLSPQSVAVTIEGPPGVLARLEEGDVKAVVDVGPLEPRPGQYRLEPRIVLPPEAQAARVSVRSVSAEEITVRVLAGRAR